MNKEEILNQFHEECDMIAQECAEAGYPSRGSNYDLRCNQIWEDYYLPALEALED